MADYEHEYGVPPADYMEFDRQESELLGQHNEPGYFTAASVRHT
ncbi:MAG: hypothetical protein ACWGP1_05645 [Syntrophobacteria bacterium]|jgi:hypothetical protein